MQVAAEDLNLVGSKTDTQYQYMDFPPQKGDEVLNVNFFRRPLNGIEVDWVKISIPGLTTTVIEEPVNDEHKGRFNRKWQEYNGYINATGTPILEWVDEIGEAMVKDFIRNDFNYIEQVSLAPDSSLHKVAGGIGWRAKAITYLNKDVPNAKQVIDDQSKRIKDLESKLDDLMAALNQPAAASGKR